MLPADQSKTVSKKEQSTIEQMQSALDKKRDEIISQNNEIIAKESSTSDSISKALETISQTKELKDKEKEILNQIQKAGYDNAYVEIDGKTVKLTIVKKDATQTDANNVIKATLELLGDEYQVEVKFINE